MQEQVPEVKVFLVKKFSMNIDENIEGRGGV